jgi:hypothetical protein
MLYRACSSALRVLPLTVPLVVLAEPIALGWRMRPALSLIEQRWRVTSRKKLVAPEIADRLDVERLGQQLGVALAELLQHYCSASTAKAI